MAALAAISGCGGSTVGDNPAKLRFFDAFFDQGNVRLNVGNHLYKAGDVGPSIENGNDVKYGNVPSGTVDLTVQTYDRVTTLATLTGQRLTGGFSYTAVALTASGTKRILLIRDSAVQTEGAALFRVINAYSTTTPLFLRVFRASDNALVYQSNVTQGTGLAAGGTTGYQSVSEASTDGASYTLRVYDASDFANELQSKTVTLKSGSPVTLFLYNRRSSNDMAIKTGTDPSTNSTTG